MRAAHVLVLGFSHVLMACATKHACPAPYRPDPAREARISALLERDPEAAKLARGTRVETCFAPGGAGVVSGDTLLLDRDLDDAHLAARTTHLLLHRATRTTRSSGDPERADEVDANALERRVLARAWPSPVTR